MALKRCLCGCFFAIIINGVYTHSDADEIQAVENAYKAYHSIYHRQYESIDVYSTAEMLGAHRAFMTGISNEAGRYRSFDIANTANTGEKQGHTITPANLVPGRVDDLFAWVKTSNFKKLNPCKKLCS